MNKNWRHRKPVACPDEDWQEKWAPPCPDGNPQRLLEIVAFRLKGADYLQLRVVFTPRDGGVCQAIVDEHPEVIYVRAISCLAVHNRPRTEEIDCPCNWWLDAPLGERVVIDVDTGEELPLYIPRWYLDKPDLYVPRPPGVLWPPEDMPRAG